MSLTYNIEVAVTAAMTSTERGRILEKFATSLLETQNYRVVQQVRLTGMEVDLLAEEKSTGERIFVECKAYRSTISAEVLFKLLGMVTYRKISAGWLISTFALGKDAKGVDEERKSEPPSERRRLQIYDPEKLAQRLISAKVIVDPFTLQKPNDLRYSDEANLLLTAFGEFWALIALDEDTGIRQAGVLFDARSGNQIISEGLFSQLSQTDTTLAGLTWVTVSNQGPAKRREVEKLKEELQSIVRVPVAEHWADYRPARPVDFIGRDQLQKSVIEFLEKVRLRQSQTRLFAFKSPSGWGKSSFVLKIAANAENKRNKKKFFVYGIDSRAAISRRFAELALFTAINKAIEEGFIDYRGVMSFGGATNPFSTDAVRSLLRSLSDQGKVLCLIFDQFEELLYKEELEAVFDEMRAICHAIDEAQENIVLGFSWKTDGTIPSEHKAYHLWHALSDRRLEFELTQFSENEVTTALNRFSIELGQPLAPQLRRLLKDHCQGYPWLLKKLCIHIFDLVRGGMDQSDVLFRSLSIQELFKKDIEKLTQVEYACILQISREAPAEFYKIANMFGDAVVNTLLDKRLIVRSGPRLSIYWDIFRDYVLTEKVPYIPINYVPQANLGSYMTGVRFLLKKRKITYDDLAIELNIKKVTADNIVRDLVMIGHAEANRRSEEITALQETELEAEKKLLDFGQSHVVYRSALLELGFDVDFDEEDIINIVRRVLRAPAVSEGIIRQYGQKLVRWFMGSGLLIRKGRSYVLKQGLPINAISQNTIGRNWRRGKNLFFGEAPPRKALKALESVLTSGTSRKEIELAFGRNVFSVLMSLNLVDSQGKLIISQDSQTADARAIIQKALYSAETISISYGFAKARPNAQGVEIGSMVAKYYDFKWSEGSKKRYGSALLQWVFWLYDNEFQKGHQSILPNLTQ